MDIAHAYKSMKTISSKKTIVFKKQMENDFQDNLKDKYISRKTNKNEENLGITDDTL